MKNNNYALLREEAVSLIHTSILRKDLYEGEYNHVTQICYTYIRVYEGLYAVLLPWMQSNRDRVRELDGFVILHDFNRASTNLKFRVNDSERNFVLLWQGIAEVRNNIRMLVFILDLIKDIDVAK